MTSAASCTHTAICRARQDYRWAARVRAELLRLLAQLARR